MCGQWTEGEGNKGLGGNYDIDLERHVRALDRKSWSSQTVTLFLRQLLGTTDKGKTNKNKDNKNSQGAHKVRVQVVYQQLNLRERLNCANTFGVG